MNEYKIAGSFYDSVLTNLPENTKKYRSIKKKLDNWKNAIKYEDIVQHADSVITLFELPKDKQMTFFEEHIVALKKAKEEAEKKEVEKITKGFAAFSGK